MQFEQLNTTLTDNEDSWTFGCTPIKASRGLDA